MIQHGSHPFLECSSKGFKPLSAFYARPFPTLQYSIEDLYQGAKVFPRVTGLSWREAKGQQPLNNLARWYDLLWWQYITNNSHLLDELADANGLQDRFGQEGHLCQASVLWRIRTSYIEGRWKPCPALTYVSPNNNERSAIYCGRFTELGPAHGKLGNPFISRTAGQGSAEYWKWLHRGDGEAHRSLLSQMHPKPPMLRCHCNGALTCHTWVQARYLAGCE